MEKVEPASAAEKFQKYTLFAAEVHEIVQNKGCNDTISLLVPTFE